MNFDGITNGTIMDALTKAEAVFATHSNIMASISGGADSDVVMDICEKARAATGTPCTYVYFDTGIEYQATKDHIRELEERCGVTIVREHAAKTIPQCCREYGQPFVSKYVSLHVERLQRNGFKWEDRPYDELVAEYPRCIASVKWWCNWYPVVDGHKSRFGIDRNPWLKEFMVQNPPRFRVSNKCCDFAKKKVAHRYQEANNFDCTVMGIRKAEGGVRSMRIKTCYDTGEAIDTYRPLFWFSDADRAEYEQQFGIVHSRCYTAYGFKRTGCAGCPYALELFGNLEAMQLYEPKLYKACTHIFADTYEYTRRYREFAAACRSSEGADPNQLTIFEEVQYDQD